MHFVSFSVFTAPGFASVKTYMYKYQAVLMGGLPEEGLARAGVKIQSKVLISATSANDYILKVQITRQN